ncbi:hypothetical protein [Chlorogloea sp. CCALA 695]|uniref:hypothetical protein n=1 Tax=Chlorogloea sp. CCALA 695 TaxID=2107693 RepID=UPI000D059552|nr:hypothetical protein [Chlorogloea sp. CCALA 695]PSB28527.1 hypothetical protein C7B70_20815 [Chlorogloea sp. CCALA 695]
MPTNSLLSASYRDLTAFKLPLTVQEGLSYLTDLNQKTILLAHYQHYFPYEWASSSVDCLYCSQADSLYSDREIEFLTLVNDRLFPIGEVENFLDRDERTFDIPLYPQNTDWYDVELEQLTTTEQFLISVLGCGYNLLDWQEAFGFTPKKLVDPDVISWQKLDQLCQTQTAPLSYLGDVLSLTDHSTGCIWLDIVYENYESLDWNRESIDYLIEHWTIAQSYLAKMEKLDEWLQKSVTNYEQVIALWNNAKK